MIMRRVEQIRKPIRLSTAAPVQKAIPSTLTAYKFKELVEERSNGRIQVDVYINNTLGDSRSMLEGLQANEVQMTDAATGSLCQLYGRIYVCRPPVSV